MAYYFQILTSLKYTSQNCEQKNAILIGNIFLMVQNLMRLKIVDKLYKKTVQESSFKGTSQGISAREISPFCHSDREEIVLSEDGVQQL